jgi:NADPH:quinone reductase
MALDPKLLGRPVAHGQRSVMRAVGCRQFGGPEVLEVVELPLRELEDGEVRIRVVAATVNPADLLFRAGGLAHDLPDASPPYVAGLELAGVIDGVGENVALSVGATVMAIAAFVPDARGAHAEFVVVPAESVVPLPRETSFVEAATVPMNGLTVRVALDDLGLDAGQTLAVTGAAGAVGGYAVQMAVADGLRVVAIASRADEDLLRGFGAEFVAERGDRAPDLVREVVPGGVDGLIDAALVGQPALAAVRDGGRVVRLRDIAMVPERGIEIGRISVRNFRRDQDKLVRLGDLVERGALTARVSETFPPERAADAHRALERGGLRGRPVLVFDPAQA